MEIALENTSGLVGGLLVLLVLLCCYCLLLLDGSSKAAASEASEACAPCGGREGFLERQPYQLGCSERWGYRRVGCRGLSGGEMPAIDAYPAGPDGCGASCRSNAARMPVL